MKLLEKLCKELGVEIGGKWKDKAGDTYKITKEGLFYKFSSGDWEEVSNLGYKMLLKEELKPVWKPKDGDVFYVPDVLSWEKSEMFLCFDWKDNEYNQELLSKKLVFRTKEEAMICAHKMLEAIKE